MALTSVSPVPLKRVPATILTGFLGAGKTSLIQNLVRSVPRGARFAFLINEFGSVGLDKTQLTGCGLENCQDEDVLELANGCICCTVADDFLPAMRKILDRNPDHILIETSGLALPRPLVKAFEWPDIKTRAVVHGVIAVVDAYALAHNDYTEDRLALERQRQADPALDHESPIQEVFWDQVGCADLVILNKCDKITADQGLAVKRELAKKLPRVKCVSSHAASVPPELFFDLENLEDKRPPDSDHDHDHDHDDEHHHDDHDHDAFVSHVLHLGPVEDAASLQTQLELLVRTHPILRVKGYLYRPGLVRREVLQGTGSQFTRWFDRAWLPHETPHSVLVFIGLSPLSETELRSGLRDFLA